MSGSDIAQQEVKTVMTKISTYGAERGAIDTVGPTIFAIALFLGGTFSAQAGFEDGKVAYARGDYGAAFREWLPIAAAGDARAQQVVGLMYSIGEGVRQDDVQAYMWIALAEVNYSSPTNRKRAARFRQRIAERLSPDQLRRARHMAQAWLANHTQ
jgi:TPR repeat protein